MDTARPTGAWRRGFDLPVVELRAGYRSAVYFDRSRRILAAEDADTRVTMQVFQRSDAAVACGIDEGLAVLALGAGSFRDAEAADRARRLPGRDRSRVARSLGRRGLGRGGAGPGRGRGRVRPALAAGRSRPSSRYRRCATATWSALEPVIELTGPYRLVAHLESVYLGVLARRPWSRATSAGWWTRPGASRCCSSPTASTTGLSRAATATPASSAAPRGWPPTPRRPGG